MFRSFYISQIVQESDTIKSFYLKPKDGQALKSYLPGQFISLKITSKEGEIISRNYTLSDAPNEDYYRLTIKRETFGKVSRHFHDHLNRGDEILISKPMGDFHLDVTTEKPIVLLSGGVGITPMMSMLEHISKNQTERKVNFIHSSLNKAVQPFFNRLKELKQQHAQLDLSLFHSNPLNDEQEGIDYDFAGLVIRETLTNIVDRENAYFLCGPVGFMEAMYNHLINLNVAETDIFYEFFGEGKTLGTKPVFKDSNSAELKVSFTRSEVETNWSYDAQNILELAEANGLNPANSCRMGTCSTCESTLVSGSIEYDPEPFMEESEGKIFICCAKPTSDISVEL